MFIDEEFGQQTWEQPRCVTEPWRVVWDVVENRFYYWEVESGETTFSQLPLVEEGWRVYLSENDGRFYFAHTPSGYVTWCNPAALPESWCMVWGGEFGAGNVVFRNVVSGQTLDEEPTAGPPAFDGFRSEKKFGEWVWIDCATG